MHCQVGVEALVGVEDGVLDELDSLRGIHDGRDEGGDSRVVGVVEV